MSSKSNFWQYINAVEYDKTIMKSALIFATTLATTFAHGPEADRRLGTWTGTKGATATANANAQPCEFKSISDLLTNSINPKWTSGTATYTSDTYHNSFILVGHYDMTFEMTDPQWHSSKDNYKFYEWITSSGAAAGGSATKGWEANDLRANGELADVTNSGATFNKKVRFCYYKAPASITSALNSLNDVCGDGGVNLDVGTSSQGTVHDSQNEGNRVSVNDPTNTNTPDDAATRVNTVSSQQSIYLEKYIGIASTCASGGLDNANSALTGLGHGPADIFAWGKIYAQQTFTLSIQENRDDSHSNDHTAAGISISANIQTSDPSISDFLYVSGESSPGVTSLGDSFPSAQGSAFGLTYTTSWSGALSATTTTTCTSTLTAAAATSNEHCYSAADTNPESTAYSTAATNSGCKAKLTSVCTIDDPTITDTITYESSGNAHNMPENGGDYAYTLGATTSVRHNSAIVVAVRQYSARQYPLGFTPGSSTGLSGTTTTGVAAAQQLVNRYNVDMGAKTLGQKLGSVAVVNNELTADKFSCTISSGKCIDDPMYILGAVYDQTLAVVCSFAQSGSWDTVTPNTGDNTAAGGSCQIAAPHSIPSSGSIPSTSAGTTDLHIQLPPKDTPQFYVYGIATYQRASTEGTVSGASSGTITGGSSSNGVASRRLRDTKQVRKAFDMVTTTLDGAPITQVIDQIHYAAQM